jgi:Anti-anti-sigma regulatory factor (antagonist of anti-sigma factor)
MDITVIEDSSGKKPVTVFQIAGDIDAQSYRELEARADEAFRNGTRRILLDLGNVRYVGSSGLRAVSAIFNLLRGASPEESDEKIKNGLRDGTFKSSLLKIARANDSVKQVFTLSGYDMFLEIHSDLQEALRSF